MNASSAEESFRFTNRSSSCLSVSPPSIPSLNSVPMSRSTPEGSPPLMSLSPCTGLPTSTCTDPGNPSNILPEKSGNASLISTARSPDRHGRAQGEKGSQTSTNPTRKADTHRMWRSEFIIQM